MTQMNDLPENPFEEDLDESAFQGAADVAGEVASMAGNALKKKIYEKLGLKNIKIVLIQIAICAFLFVVAILLLYGGVSYLNSMGDQIWSDVLHWNTGSMEDDYQTTYYDEAQAVLDAINNGTLDIANDMAMLSKEDMVMILEYIVQYNEDTSYETTPEKIRYEYTERGYSPDSYSIPDDAGPGNQISSGDMSYVPQLWQTVKGYHTVSYQTLGKNYVNPYTGENEFAVPWQTIIVLCEMLAENNYKNFGSNEDGWKDAHGEDFATDLMFETSMDGYFVTDAQVNALCNMVSYTYNTYAVNNNMDYVQWTQGIIEDGNAHYQDDLSYGIDISMEDIHKYTYEIKEPYSTGSGATQKDYTNLRIPELAPYSIANFYTLVTYEYKSTPTVSYGDVDMCTTMNITTDARRFMMMVTNLIPDFTFQHFFELMEQMPGAEKEIEKYKKIEKLYDKGEKERKRYERKHKVSLELSEITDTKLIKSYQSTHRVTSGFPGEGIVIGENARGRENGGDDFEGANSVWIGTHYDADGNVVMSPRGVEAAYNDWFYIDSAANISMNQSDELTQEEVKKVLEEFGSWISDFQSSELKKHFTSESTAEFLYGWQEQNNASITAVLAIAQIEGTMGISGTADATWNFFNYNVGKNYKKEYTGRYSDEDFAFQMALGYQMNAITTNYIKNKQSSYFEMQFGDGFISNKPGQEYYKDAEGKITHSYCPWWADCSFPFIGKNGGKLTGEGWCNNCAAARKNLLAAVGKNLESTFVWPVPAYTRVSSEFGRRTAPTEGASTNHKGMDIAAASGADIVATADGKVINDPTVYTKSSGYSITLAHSDGITVSYYLHMDAEPLVRYGETVTKGQKIAVVGTGGISTGPHLHFGIKEYGEWVDPRKYVSEPTRK